MAVSYLGLSSAAMVFLLMQERDLSDDGDDILSDDFPRNFLLPKISCNSF